MDTGQQRQLEEMVLYKNKKAQVVGIFNALPGYLFGEGEQYVSENGRQWTRYPPLQFYLHKYFLPINATQSTLVLNIQTYAVMNSSLWVH